MYAFIQNSSFQQITNNDLLQSVRSLKPSFVGIIPNKLPLDLKGGVSDLVSPDLLNEHQRLVLVEPS